MKIKKKLKKYGKGGEIPEKKKIEDSFVEANNFLKTWQQSPMYNEMLNNSSSGNEYSKISNYRNKSLNLNPTNNLNVEKTLLNDPNTTGFVRKGTPVVNISSDWHNNNEMLSRLKTESDTLKARLGETPDYKIPTNFVTPSTIVHEMSHITDWKGLPKTDLQKIKSFSSDRDKNKFSNYVANPSETRSRLNEIRYENSLLKYYNPLTEKINKDQYNNYLKDKSKGNALKDLKNVYSDDEIIDMLNSISENKSSQEQIPMAKNGGSIKKYGDGGKKTESILNNRPYGEGMINNFWNSLDFSTPEQREHQKQFNFINDWYANRKGVISTDSKINNKGEIIKKISFKPLKRVQLESFPDVNKEYAGAFTKGSYDPITNKIKIAPKTDTFANEKDNLSDTYIHELNHAYQKPMGYNADYYSSKIFDVINNNKKLRDEYNYDKEDGRYRYTPAEVHSRIMQFRYENNLKPNQVITPTDFKNYKNKGVIGDFNDEEIIDMLNGTVQNNEEQVPMAGNGGKNVNTLEGDLYSKILLNRNKNLDFVQRAYAVGQYPESNMFQQFDPNEFGKKNSHLMGWGEDENGQAYMSPSIFNDRNEAIKVPNQYADYISNIGYKNATGIPTKQNGGNITRESEWELVNEDLPKAGNGLSLVKTLTPIGNKVIPRNPSLYKDAINNVDKIEHNINDRYRVQADDFTDKNYPTDYDEDSGHNDYVDALRHSATAMYTTSGQGNFLAPLKVPYTNVMGLAHELKGLGSYVSNPDKLTWQGAKQQLRETGSDLYNNFVGSMIGGLPINIENKEKILKFAKDKNILSDLSKKQNGGKLPKRRLNLNKSSDWEIVD